MQFTQSRTEYAYICRPLKSINTEVTHKHMHIHTQTQPPAIDPPRAITTGSSFSVTPHSHKYVCTCNSTQSPINLNRRGTHTHIRTFRPSLTRDKRAMDMYICPTAASLNGCSAPLYEYILFGPTTGNASQTEMGRVRAQRTNNEPRRTAQSKYQHSKNTPQPEWRVMLCAMREQQQKTHHPFGRCDDDHITSETCICESAYSLFGTPHGNYN